MFVHFCAGDARSLYLFDWFCQNRIDLSVACRVFFNLGDLREVVEGYVVSAMEDVAKACNLNVI